MSDVICISPIDGSIVAKRKTADARAIETAVLAAGVAQRSWARVPIAARGAYILQALNALEAANSEIVPELARQMGRPVRYGGEFRSVKERVLHMVEIAEAALAPVIPSIKEGGLCVISGASRLVWCWWWRPGIIHF